MLPSRGRRRALALFFFRLILVFVFMWLPSLAFIFVGGAWSSPWLAWAGGTWSHLQSAASAVAALTKDDIRLAFFNLIYCRRHEQPKNTYRVALQSVSVVLENDEPSTHDDAETPQAPNNGESNEFERHGESRQMVNQQPDPEQPVGDPNAYWPSQRPMRVDPRVARYLQEQEENKATASSLSRFTLEEYCE